MKLIRDRRSSAREDREVTDDVISIARSGEAAARLWVPPRQVVFGPRDRAHPRYDRARKTANAFGYADVERSAGGRPVAFDGRTSVGVVLAVPTTNREFDIGRRYDLILDPIQRALAAIGVQTDRTEPPDSFCPGGPSLTASGKIVGCAQRVTDNVTTVGAVVYVEHSSIVSVTAAIYPLFDLSFDPDTVDSVRAAGGPSDPCVVIDTLEPELVERVRSADTDRP